MKLKILASTFFLTLVSSVVIANPLLNINPEDRSYDILQASRNSTIYTFSIKPVPAYAIAIYPEDYERIKNSVNVEDGTECYWKPLSGMAVDYFSSPEDGFFIPGASGKKYKKGNNLFLYQDGFLSLGRSLVLYYGLRERFDKDGASFDLHRTYAKWLFGKFSIEGGIDNLDLGPGMYGVLLSANTDPYPMIKFGTEEPLQFIGYWEFVIMKGWLQEDREDRNNPEIFAMRISWKPCTFLEFGATRTTLYGGTGRPHYHFWQYPKMVIGANENVPGDKYDNDAYGGYDISLYLPINKIWNTIKTSRIYYQVAGTDIKAPWQKEDKWRFERNALRLYEKAFQIGLLVSTEDNIFRIEYVTTARSFYSHHYYNVEGYTYKGLCLGYPYGRNMQSLVLKHKIFFRDWIALETTAGLYRGPCFDREDKTNRGYYDILKPASELDEQTKASYVSMLVSLMYERYSLDLYIRYDRIKDYDENTLPTQFSITESDKNLFSAGLSLSARI